jgi:predicted acyl esterase
VSHDNYSLGVRSSIGVRVDHKSDALMKQDEVRDGMRISWDAPITASDGIVLRADIFRPLGDNSVPAILS